MSEFKFTDAEWRKYQQMPDQGYSHRGHLEFVVNRWLTEHDAEVTKAAEERIIKLLEDKGTHPQCRNQPPLKLDGSIAWCKEGGEYCTMTLRQIGHIKGENK